MRFTVFKLIWHNPEDMFESLDDFNFEMMPTSSSIRLAIIKLLNAHYIILEGAVPIVSSNKTKCILVMF